MIFLGVKSTWARWVSLFWVTAALYSWAVTAALDLTQVWERRRRERWSWCNEDNVRIWWEYDSGIITHHWLSFLLPESTTLGWRNLGNARLVCRRLPKGKVFVQQLQEVQKAQWKGNLKERLSCIVPPEKENGNKSVTYLLRRQTCPNSLMSAPSPDEVHQNTFPHVLYFHGAGDENGLIWSWHQARSNKWMQQRNQGVEWKTKDDNL